MSNWDRKALLNLSDVIRQRLLDTQTTSEQKALLEPILKRCDSGSRTVDASAQTLLEVTMQLRDACEHEAACQFNGYRCISRDCTLLCEHLTEA